MADSQVQAPLAVQHPSVRNNHMKKLTLLFALLITAQASAATYYIDFATGSNANNGTAKATPWKYAPGMTSFAGSYAHAAGDQFIFKGGVTWPDPAASRWNIAYSGSSLNPDYYGVDATWYAGGSWTNPVFDGGSKSTGIVSPYITITGSYLTFDGLRVQNTGIAGKVQGNYVIEAKSDHDLLFENMVLPTEGWIAIYCMNQRGATMSNLTFVNNDISASAWGIGIGTASANSVTSNIVIHDNHFHDLHDQIASGAHCNGIIIFGPGNDATQYLTGISIYNNSFSGDFSRSDTSAAGMTALIFCEYCNGAVNIYNNYGYDTITNTSSGYVIEGGPTAGAPAANFGVYNNSFQMTAQWEGFMSVSAINSLTSENNIYQGGTTVDTIGIYGHVTTFTSNYDIFYGWSVGQPFYINGVYKNWAQLQSAGYEANGKNLNPIFNSASDLTLQPTSPAISTGVNLSTVFTTDALGITRTAPWDIGAYKYVASGAVAIADLVPPAGTTYTFPQLLVVPPGVASSTVIQLTNTGTATLNIASVVLAGAGFAISANTCGSTLAAGASCTVSVTFSPTAALCCVNPYTGSLTFTDDSGGVGGSTQVVTLSGTGSAPLTLGSGTWGSGTIN
jgi:hypothetical protein